MAFALADIISGVVSGLGGTVVNAATADQRARQAAYDAEQAAAAQKQKQLLDLAAQALQNKQQNDSKVLTIVLLSSAFVMVSVIAIVAVRVHKQKNTS